MKLLYSSETNRKNAVSEKFELFYNFTKITGKYAFSLGNPMKWKEYEKMYKNTFHLFSFRLSTGGQPGIVPQLSFAVERRRARQGQNEKPVRSASFKVAFFCRCDIIKSAPAGWNGKAPAPGIPGHDKNTHIGFTREEYKLEFDEPSERVIPRK